MSSLNRCTHCTTIKSVIEISVTASIFCSKIFKSSLLFITSDEVLSESHCFLFLLYTRHIYFHMLTTFPEMVGFLSGNQNITIFICPCRHLSCLPWRDIRTFPLSWACGGKVSRFLCFDPPYCSLLSS
jgi:hypothetical protein